MIKILNTLKNCSSTSYILDPRPRRRMECFIGSEKYILCVNVSTSVKNAAFLVDVEGSSIHNSIS